MKPIRTPQTNAVLELEGKDARHDLPAERCRFVDPDSPEVTPRHGFETTWRPDDHERERIAAGADIVLRLWGTGHPPVMVLAGEPPADSPAALLRAGHVQAALGYLFADLATGGNADQFDPAETTLPIVAGDRRLDVTAIGFAQAFERALKDTADLPADLNGQPGPAGDLGYLFADLATGEEPDVELDDRPESDTPGP